MRHSRKTVRIVQTLVFLLLLTAAIAPALAAEGEGGAAGAAAGAKIGYLGAALGAGMVVIGAGVGIGKLAAAAADGVARQPQATSQITGAVQLPLFLLEGVAIIAVVTCLLIVLMK